MSSHFYAMLFRMKYINRWSLMRNTSVETLSQHSIETAFIAHALAIITNTRLGGNVNADRVALIALFHDAPEIITGDLPTPVKYYNKEIKEAYKTLESEAANRLVSLAPDDMQDVFDEIFNNKDQEMKKFIKAADKLSALIKCREEIIMGNTEFAVAQNTTITSLKNLNLPAVDIFMDEFLESFSLPLDQQRDVTTL